MGKELAFQHSIGVCECRVIQTCATNQRIEPGILALHVCDSQNLRFPAASIKTCCRCQRCRCRCRGGCSCRFGDPNFLLANRHTYQDPHLPLDPGGTNCANFRTLTPELDAKVVVVETKETNNEQIKVRLNTDTSKHYYPLTRTI